MTKKGSAKFSALKGAVQGTLSHRISAQHSPKIKSAEHSAPEGQCPRRAVHKGPRDTAQNRVPQKRAVHKYPRGPVQNRAPQRGSATKMAVQSTLPKKGSAPIGQCRAQCTNAQKA